MAGETIVNLIGNLVADPEIRYTPSGAAVANFTVASTPRSYDKNTDKWVDGEALFLRCSVWRIMAENVSESLRKGTRVMVSGRLVQRSFETKEGEKRTVMEVQVEEIGASLKFAMVDVRRPDREGGQQAASRPQQRQAPAEDPWASALPAGRGYGGGFADEPPFHHPRSLDTYSG